MWGFLCNYNGKDNSESEDRVITTYLFANTVWRKNVHRCELLSEKKAVFLSDFIEKSRSVKAMFYALAKLLNSVGMEPYKDIGIERIYKLVMKDTECRVQFYDYTLYYLEEYMVSQGSQIALFVREEI